MSLAATLLVLLAAPVRSPVPSAKALRVDWNAPTGCSDPDSFLASIQSRTERVRRAEAGEDALRVEVQLGRLPGGKVHGELRIVDDAGRSEVRKVDGATCGEVADALALTAALALGATGIPPIARASAPSPIGSTPTGSAPTDAAPVPPSPPTTEAPAAPASAAPPAVVAPNEGPSEPPLQPPAPKDALPPPVAVEVSPSPGPPPSPPAVRLSFGVGPVIAQVVSPTFELGAAAAVGVAMPGGGAVDRSLGLSVAHLRNDLLGASPDVAITWTGVSVTACPGWGIGGFGLTIEACAGVTGGWLRATEMAVSVPKSVARSWWSVGPTLRARLTLGWGLQLVADASAQIPLIRRDFTTSTPDETVARTPSVAGMLGVVIAREL